MKENFSPFRSTRENVQNEARELDSGEDDQITPPYWNIRSNVKPTKYTENKILEMAEHLNKKAKEEYLLGFGVDKNTRDWQAQQEGMIEDLKRQNEALRSMVQVSKPSESGLVDWHATSKRARLLARLFGFTTTKDEAVSAAYKRGFAIAIVCMLPLIIKEIFRKQEHMPS